MNRIIYIFLIFILTLNYSLADSSVYVHSYSTSNNSSVNVQVDCLNGVCTTTKNITGNPANVSTQIIIATASPDISSYVNEKTNSFVKPNPKRNISEVKTRINQIKITDTSLISGNSSGTQGTARSLFEQVKTRIDAIFAKIFPGIF